MLELDPGVLGRELPVDVTRSALRAASQAATSAVSVAWSGMRRSRHCRPSALSSISATFSQLPCLGV